MGRRMSNISCVLSTADFPNFQLHASSLTQAGNGVRKRLLAIYADLVRSHAKTTLIFDTTVNALVAGAPLQPPAGSQNPGSSASLVVRYNRSAAVAAWVLQNANRVSEACKKLAPFKRKGGTPYL